MNKREFLLNEFVKNADNERESCIEKLKQMDALGLTLGQAVTELTEFHNKVKGVTDPSDFDAYT